VMTLLPSLVDRSRIGMSFGAASSRQISSTIRRSVSVAAHDTMIPHRPSL
jgi:hypothetical protein